MIAILCIFLLLQVHVNISIKLLGKQLYQSCLTNLSGASQDQRLTIFFFRPLTKVLDGDSFKHTFIFLKHAAKIQLIFNNPNKNKQNQAFPNQKFHFIDAFPSQKLSFSLYFQIKKNSASMHIQPKRSHYGAVPRRR